MDKPCVDLAIPSSYTLNLQSLMQRTLVLSFLSRAAGIYGVENIYIYHDPITHDPEVERQIIKILRYLSTPPYLKKMLFRREPELSYVGLAPPLTLYSHKKWVAIKNLNFPEYRIGLVIGRKKDRYLIDVGLDKYVAVREKPPQNIVVVEITKATSEYLIGRVLSKGEYRGLGFYPGYKVKRLKMGFSSFLTKYNGCRICLTRYGEYIGSIWHKLIKELGGYERMLLILGSYEYGLKEIFEAYSADMDKLCDYKINLVYKQEVETIRVEEATLIGLSIVDFLKHMRIDL